MARILCRQHWSSASICFLSLTTNYNKIITERLQSSASKRLWYMPKAATINYLNVCQGHKNRPRSVKVTVSATSPLDLTSCQIRSLHVMNRRCSGSRNIAKFHEVPRTGGDFARLYLENSKLHKKSLHEETFPSVLYAIFAPPSLKTWLRWSSRRWWVHIITYHDM